MGGVAGQSITQAAEYLLKLVLTKANVAYSVFYNDETSERSIAEEMGVDEHLYSPLVLLDLAAGQLEELGWVTRVEVDAVLPDGERDYQIALTSTGRLALAKGTRVHCRDVML